MVRGEGMHCVGREDWIWGEELNYALARWQDPETGRFTSLDPARDGMNWYAYCAGNPIAYVDPTGLGYNPEQGGGWGPIYNFGSGGPTTSGGGGGGGGGGNKELSYTPDWTDWVLSQNDPWMQKHFAAFGWKMGMDRGVWMSYDGLISGWNNPNFNPFIQATYAAENWLGFESDDTTLAAHQQMSIDKHYAPPGYEPQTDMSKFLTYSMGKDFADLIDMTIIKKFYADPGVASFSFPSQLTAAGILLASPIPILLLLGINGDKGLMGINMANPYMGGYNPLFQYNTRISLLSEVGWVGLFAHELFHQLQYRNTPIGDPSTINRLGVVERKGRPYDCGDPVQFPHILRQINTIGDISTLEGRAQFIGQWNADVFSYLTGQWRNETPGAFYQRLGNEALIMQRSGFNSEAVQEVLSFMQKNNIVF